MASRSSASLAAPAHVVPIDGRKPVTPATKARPVRMKPVQIAPRSVAAERALLAERARPPAQGTRGEPLGFARWGVGFGLFLTFAAALTAQV